MVHSGAGHSVGKGRVLLYNSSRNSPATVVENCGKQQNEVSNLMHTEEEGLIEHSGRYFRYLGIGLADKFTQK